jgi:hypothetical protein
MNIPKGATHTSAGHYYRRTLGEWLVFSSRGWESSDCHPVWLDHNATPIFDAAEQTRQAIIDLAAKQCGMSGDSIRQLATVLAAEGYRKFEIVEGDV